MKKYQLNETKTENAETTASNPFEEIAQEIHAVIAKRFPFGAINRLDVVERLKIPETELDAYLAAFYAYDKEAETERSISKMANITQPLMFGNCGLFTNYATGYFKNKYPDLMIESLYLKSHVALLIGRKPGSDPNRMETWGDQSIVCDPWASTTYKLSQLAIKRREEDIPFYSRVVNNYTEASQGFIRNQTHYLDGKPEIYAGEASMAYDRMLMAWVAEDQRREQQSAVRVAKTPSAIKSTFNPEEIKSAMSKLSKTEAWRFSQKTNTAWLECESIQQTERIIASLKACKFAQVTLEFRKDTKAPIIKCDNIDRAKMMELVSALTIPSSSLTLLLQGFK